MAEAPPTLAVFGAAGQVGSALCALPVPLGWRLLPLGRACADIADPSQVATALSNVASGVVVNLAGFTQVDRAESDAEAAFAANRDGAGNIARAAAERGLAVIALSSDYVFPGDRKRALSEQDATGPLSVYGASKLAGEAAVLAANRRALVLRTAWVFGRHGNNFVKAILRRALTQPELGVVADQVGCPTPAQAIAETVWALVRRLTDSHAAEDFGIFHYCGDEATSWHGFAAAALAEAAALGHRVGRAHPITTADYPLPARRPTYSVLDCSKLAGRFGITQPSWRAALRNLLPEVMKGL